MRRQAMCEGRVGAGKGYEIVNARTTNKNFGYMEPKVRMISERSGAEGRPANRLTVFVTAEM